MRKIATPQDIQVELHRILTACQGPERPSRKKIASDLRDLADRVANNVAKTILQQMGGNRLFAMLGATLVNTTSDSVTFKWPNRERSRGNAVKVTLLPDDTYEMTFFNMSGRGAKKVKEYRGVYADQLIDLFEKQTGWALRL